MDVGHVAGQDGFVALAVVALAKVHDGLASALEEFAARGVGGQGGAVARQ